MIKSGSPGNKLTKLSLPQSRARCSPCFPGDGNEERQHADSSRALEWTPPSLEEPPGRDQWNIESPLWLRHFNNRQLQYPTCR